LFQGYHLGFCNDVNSDCILDLQGKPVIWLNNFYILGFFYDILSQNFKSKVGVYNVKSIDDPREFVKNYIKCQYANISKIDDSFIDKY
jgi:hypothetical protein